MHNAIDGSSGGHRVFEDLVPFREHQVAGDHHRAALITLGEEGKQHFHPVAVLLHVTDVVNDDDIEVIEALQRSFEFKVSFGDQQSLDGKRSGNDILLARAVLRR